MRVSQCPIADLLHEVSWVEPGADEVRATPVFLFFVLGYFHREQLLHGHRKRNQQNRVPTTRVLKHVRFHMLPFNPPSVAVK